MSQTSPWFIIAMQVKRKLENDKETSNSKRWPNVVKKPMAQTPNNRTTCETKDIAPPQEPEWVLVSNKSKTMKSKAESKNTEPKFPKRKAKRSEALVISKTSYAS